MRDIRHRCETCRFEEDGLCRRNPPIAFTQVSSYQQASYTSGGHYEPVERVTSSVAFAHPPAVNWCGEHKFDKKKFMMLALVGRKL